jgi:hypothetical protein
MSDASWPPSAADGHPVLEEAHQPARATCPKGTPPLRFGGRLGGIRQGRQVVCGSLPRARSVCLPARSMPVTMPQLDRERIDRQRA